MQCQGKQIRPEGAKGCRYLMIGVVVSHSIMHIHVCILQSLFAFFHDYIVEWELWRRLLLCSTSLGSAKTVVF